MIQLESNILSIAVHFSFALILAAFFIAFLRLAKGPELADRVLVLDLFAILVIGFSIIFTIVSNEQLFLNAAVIIAVIAFMGTIIFAKFLKKRVNDK